MAGLKASAEASGKPKKAPAKTNKDKSTGKASALSAEYIVDSDSDGGIEDTNLSSEPIASVKGSASTPAKAKKTATLSDTASKSNGFAKGKTVEQSGEKHQSGSRDTKANGNTPQSVKHPRSKTSNRVEITPSSQLEGVPVTLAAKSVAKTTSTTKANVSVKPKLQKVVQVQESSDEEDEGTNEGSIDSTGLDQEDRKKAESKGSSKAQPSSAKATTPKVPALKQTPPSLESSEGSTSEESSSEEEDVPTGDSAKRAKQPQTPSKSTVPIYKAPPGFAPALISHAEASCVPALFSPNNLASKQVWHITLPAAIPISAIKEISMEKILRGGTAVSHNGAEYGFVSGAKSQQNRAHVLLPNPEHSDYRAAPKAITRSLHLQQTLKLPNLAKTPKDNTAGTQLRRQTAKVVHEQPSGLRMRYAPFGDESGILGLETSSEEDGEPQPEGAVFRMPPSLRDAQQQGKRRDDGIGDAEPQSTPRTSPKKRRIKEVTDDVAPETPSKKRRKKHRGDGGKEVDAVEGAPEKTETNGNSHPQTGVNGHQESTAEVPSPTEDRKKHDGETPEARAERKAKKQNRKEEHNRQKKEKKRKKAGAQDNTSLTAAEA